MDTRPEPTPSPLPRGTGCRDGHTGRSGPGENPELGMVPSRTSVWIGAVLVALVAAGLWTWLPGTRPWILAVLGLWWLLTLGVQAALGHRGRCLVRRTGRWMLGPAGALLDPFDDD